MNTKFKVGDRVRLVRDVVGGILFKSGDRGTINEVKKDDTGLYYGIQQNKPCRCGNGFWWVEEDAISQADSELYHDQFKSPVDGSWRNIIPGGDRYIATHAIELGAFFLRRRTKRGLLNTLHRMKIQTRKCKSNGKDGK